MQYSSLKINKKKIFTGLMLFVFMLISSTSVSAQTENDFLVDASVTISPSSKKENVSTVSSSNSMNFVLWFMGSKQDPKSSISTEGNNTKKQVIISGTAPNRLLIKAFLKKAVELDSMIA